MKSLFKNVLLVGVVSSIFMTGCTSSANYDSEIKSTQDINTKEDDNIEVFELLDPHMNSYQEWKNIVTNSTYSENESGVNLYKYYDRNYRDLFSSSFISYEEQEFLYNAIKNRDLIALKDFYQRNKDISYNSLGEKVDFSFLSNATDDFTKDLNFNVTYEDFKEKCLQTSKDWKEYYHLENKEDLANKLNIDLENHYRSLFLVELAEYTLKVTIDEYSQVNQNSVESSNTFKPFTIDCLNCNDPQGVLIKQDAENISCSKCSFKYIKTSCPDCSSIVVALPNSDFGVCLRCDGFID